MFHGSETSGINLPIWFSNVKLPEFPKLEKNIKADVCIIGAGISGLTTGYNLCREGKSVVILEDGKIGSGETGRTTGHLTNGIDDHYYKIEKLFGLKGAKFTAQSHTAAIDTIEKIIKKENIKCNFCRVDAYLFLQPKDKIDLLEKELAASHRAGLTTVELIKKPKISGIKLRHCLRFPKQGQIHVLKYIAGLAKVIIKKKGKIFEMSHALEITPGKTSIVKLKNGCTVHAKYIVIATNSPIYDKTQLFAKQKADRTYVIGARIPKGTLEKALFWDTANPYHYVRVQPGNKNSQYDFALIGGEDHRVGENHKADEKFKLIETWARRHIPKLGKIEYQWSGQIMEPVDYLAFIGKYPLTTGNIYVATGDSGNGLTHGTIAGILITDLIMKRNNPWQEIYNPARKIIKKMPSLISLGINTVSHFIAYLTPGETKNINRMARNSGKVIRKGAAKIAVYRDQKGKFHQCTAICPHMKGILAWNATENTWDCPLHGSRFTAYGDVINGPANASIKTQNGVKKIK